VTKNLHKIKMIISDVDGVWTDGTFYTGTDGIELKRFSVLDGAGVVFARAAKLKIALISGRYSPATEQRAKELEIKDLYLDDSEIAYIGDDLIDIPVMEKVSVPIAVNNAVDEVKKLAVFCTKSSGGSGAFREAVTWIIDQQGRTESIMKIMKEHIKNN
jgi:3-deoxy-D-manno-octulosonate 8-phosphate phosphatase (KDO 8-P phosphatase)